MAQHQSGTSGGTSTQGQSGMQGSSGMQGTSGTQSHTGTQGQTGMRGGGNGADNVTYDLISIAYHGLQAVETYKRYEQDAGRSGGNQQFADFFRRTCEANKQCAEEALQLLQQCLSGQGTQGGQSGQQGSQTGQSGQYGRGTR